MADFRLDGKVAIVTGASSGLGAHFAQVLAGAGADLVIGARRSDRLEVTRRRVEQLGRRCVAVAADVTSPADATSVVDAATTEFGDVHVLVNNAGTGHAEPTLREDPETFLPVLATNLAGAYYVAQAFARACVARGHGGSIINISSVLALAGSDAPQAAYSASKAGLLGLTRDLAMQWSGRYGIRVNALAPSFFESEMTAPLLSDDAARARVLKRTPMGRLGRVEELDGPLLLLASDAGSYVTGVTLAVDGGWSLH